MSLFRLSSIKKLITLFIFLTGVVISSTGFAAPLGVFGSWNQFADDEGVGKGGFVDPGWGGQAFDAEYFFYKMNGNTLSIGLQTGFDVDSGVQKYQGVGKDYFAGDLALSFNGSSDYEYAVDFGFNTRDINGNTVGGQPDSAGVYQDVSWGGDVSFSQSLPFAMSTGELIDEALITTSADKVGESYYRIVEISLLALNIDTNSPFSFDAHWTMSCGNDEINGTANVAPVPEPSTIILLGSGLLVLAFWRKKQI